MRFDRLVSRRRVLGIDSLMMNDPEGVRHVLGTAMEKYKRLVSTRRVLAGLGREGVFLAEGAEWRLQRLMLARTLIGIVTQSFIVDWQ